VLLVLLLLLHRSDPKQTPLNESKRILHFAITSCLLQSHFWSAAGAWWV
jgi:hypothetical protein